MKYEDLLTVPFKLNGRDKDGMDCYGLVLEMCRRSGTPLIDINAVHVASDTLAETAGKLNVKQITEAEAVGGDIVQCTYQNEIHIGYLLDSRTCIHMTDSGVRISPTLALRNRKYFKVV